MRLAAKNLGHALGGTPHKRGAIYAHIEETISMFAAPPPFACDNALPPTLRAPSASPPFPHASPRAARVAYGIARAHHPQARTARAPDRMT